MCWAEKEKSFLSSLQPTLLLPYLFLVGMFEEREEVESSREKCRLFSKKDGKNCGKKIQKHKTQHKKTQSFSFLWHYLHTQDDIKICKLHPIIRSKFAVLTFHRSQTSSVSLQKLWKNRKESKKKFFYDPPEAAPNWTFSFQFEFFGSTTDTSPLPPTQFASNLLTHAHLLCFIETSKSRPHEQQEADELLLSIYLFICERRPKESQFHFRRTFATSSHLSQSLCIKIDPPTTPEKQK